jgi:hypothetical protein
VSFGMPRLHRRFRCRCDGERAFGVEGRRDIDFVSISPDLWLAHVALLGRLTSGRQRGQSHLGIVQAEVATAGDTTDRSSYVYAFQRIALMLKTTDRFVAHNAAIEIALGAR